MQKMLQKLEIDKNEKHQKEVLDKKCMIKHKLQGYKYIMIIFFLFCLLTPFFTYFRRIFDWLKRRIQNTIVQKEITTSSVALAMNKFRLAFQELAKKLVHEGKLPDTDLIFHLTQAEIERILVKKSPSLVSK